MARTPNSAPDPYITVAEFLVMNDPVPVGMLIRDDQTTATVAEMTDTMGADYPNVLLFLKIASGDLEGACLAADRYSTDDLAALNGNSQLYLKSIVSALAMGKLYGRRGGPLKDSMVEANYAEAKAVLDRLRDGDEVFAFVETEDAGLPKNYTMTAQDIFNDNTLTVASHRAMGYRLNVRTPQGFNGGPII